MLDIYKGMILEIYYLNRKKYASTEYKYMVI